jgi:hypothetical protein
VYEPIQVENLKHAKPTAASGNRADWLARIHHDAFIASPGDVDSDREFITHYLSYVKGSTRALTVFLIAVCAWDLRLDIHATYPFLVDTLTSVTVQIKHVLTPEERLVMAMGRGLCCPPRFHIHCLWYATPHCNSCT